MVDETTCNCHAVSNCGERSDLEPFQQEGFGRLPLSVVPLRALTHESEKMGITHIKEGKRQ